MPPPAPIFQFRRLRRDESALRSVLPESHQSSASAWEADALVTQPSQTSGYGPNGRPSLEVRMRTLQPLETILPPGNADVVLRFYESAS
jgi:hypothetical protein